MTLILSCATQKYAIQVADRRLTIIGGKGNGHVVDDNANKSLLFCGRMAFGYTGLAHIISEKTDKWLTRILSESKCESLSDACNCIRDSATEYLKRLSISKILKRQAFVGVGWTKSSTDEHFKPVVCQISNAIDSSGNWINEANDKFELKYSILEETVKFGLLSAGHEFKGAHRNIVMRYLHECIENDENPYDIMKILADAIRTVSTYDSTVGEALLAVSIPKVRAGEKAVFAIASTPNKDSLTFLYIIPVGDNKGIQYGPNFVCAGSAMTDFQGGPIPSSGN